jgi:hypothetical protein
MLTCNNKLAEFISFGSYPKPANLHKSTPDIQSFNFRFQWIETENPLPLALHK